MLPFEGRAHNKSWGRRERPKTPAAAATAAIGQAAARWKSGGCILPLMGCRQLAATSQIALS